MTVEQEGLQPLEVLWQMLFISAVYIVCSMIGDNGYMTNYLGFIAAFISFYFIMRIPGWHNILRGRISKYTRNHLVIYAVLISIIMVFLPAICSVCVNPKDVNYNRFARRIMLYSNFDKLQEAGYRYTETDAEFMVIMNHAMQQSDGGDPLSNDYHMLHPSVSTGQSPVVLNDLSMPLAFFGAYGTWLTTALFFLLLIALVSLVMNHTLTFRVTHGYNLTNEMQWRLLAIFMWAGTSVYIYVSYLGWIPFTGRLIPGYGVDAVGEALETSLLLAFMASVTCKVAGMPAEKMKNRSVKDRHEESVSNKWSMEELATTVEKKDDSLSVLERTEPSTKDWSMDDFK